MIKKFLLLIAGILIIILIFNYNIGIPCIFFEATRLYCPGCGITRALKSLITLNFYQAFRYNMLLTLLTPFFILYLLNLYVFKSKYKIPQFIWDLILMLLYFLEYLEILMLLNFLLQQ